MADKTFMIRCEWTMYEIVQVKAKSRQDAINKALKTKQTSSAAKYVKNSYRVAEVIEGISHEKVMGSLPDSDRV